MLSLSDSTIQSLRNRLGEIQPRTGPYSNAMGAHATRTYE